jgi:imidazolonepropionase-like amidohydrolase
MRRFRGLAALVATLLALPAAAVAQVDTGPPLEVLYGFTLIDGLGGPPIPDAAMAIRGNQILTISSRRELLSGPNAPRDAVAVNLGGGYVIPGLIDAHVHLATTPNRARAEAELHRMLYSGITAVRDMAGDARSLAALARDSRLGEIESPDVVYSALMAGPSFFADPRPQSSAAGERAGQVPWMQAITAESDLVTAVARAKGTSATGVKIYANLATTEVERITAEAHRQGMRVWAHSMVFPARPLEVVRADVDVVSHVCRMAWEAMADAPTEYHHDRTPQFGTFSATSPIFDELFGEMRQRGTILDATLALYARSDSLRRASPDAVGGERCDTDFARSLVRRAHELGIRIAAGTDFMTPADAPFPALFDELEELVENGGLTPMAAIQAATSVAAEALGISATHGSLRHGRPVTFVLLANDPLQDIGNLRSIQAVWKNAVRYDREAYRPRFAEETRPTSTTAVAARGFTTPRQALDAWLAVWRRYDLDGVRDVFLDDASLTYFSSDSEGVKQGLEAVLEHHRQLGFVPRGFQPEQELWVEDTLIADFAESAVVTGVWYFGNRVAREGAGRGPLTMVLERTSNGYKISHLNLANYPR